MLREVDQPIIALMSATSRPGIYRCRHQTHIVEDRSPEGKLARRLLVAGYDAGRPFWTRWSQGPVSLKWASLAAAATGDVKEDDKGLRWRIWEPFPKGARG